MNRYVLIQGALWAALGGAFAWAAHGLRDSTVDTPLGVTWRAPAAASVGGDSTSVSLFQQVDPFRMSHVPGQASPPVQQVDAMAAPAKPVLRVIGFSGGPGHWRAVVAGLPASPEGVVVQAGDTVSGGYRIRSITPAEITVSGLDTVWHLRVRGPQ